MADTRTPWSRMSKENVAVELKRRQITKRVAIDNKSTAVCCVCGKRPRSGEQVYMPAQNVSATNKITGHVDCVDSLCAKLVAEHKPVRDALIKHEAPKPVVKVETSGHDVSELDKLREALAAEQRARLAAEAEAAGLHKWHEGFQAALEAMRGQNK